MLKLILILLTLSACSDAAIDCDAAGENAC